MFRTRYPSPEVSRVLACLRLFSSGTDVDFVYTVCRVRKTDVFGPTLGEEEILAAHAAEESLYVTLLGARNSGSTQAAGLDNGPPMTIRLRLIKVDRGHDGKPGGLTCLGSPYIGDHGAVAREFVPSVQFRFTWDPAEQSGKFNYVPSPDPS